ncbi:MAG: Protein RecA [Anaerolineales bacterium]|nr:Protein RecA [Anaerolineales bacterium]
MAPIDLKPSLAARVLSLPEGIRYRDVGRKRKQRRLDALAASLRKQYGPRALRRAETPGVPHVATGFPPLDEALGVGGLPRGRITECVGPYTSGKTTVVLKALAEATAAGALVAVIDLERTFNPDYARRAGVDLSRVLLPPAEDPLQALEVVRYLATEEGVGVLLFNDVANLIGQDHAAAWLSDTLRRITGALHRSRCALVFLTTTLGAQDLAEGYPSGFALAHYAAVRLGFEKTEGWTQ